MVLADRAARRLATTAARIIRATSVRSKQAFFLVLFSFLVSFVGFLCSKLAATPSNGTSRVYTVGRRETNVDIRFNAEGSEGLLESGRCAGHTCI